MITKTPTPTLLPRATRRAHSISSHPSARAHRREVARWALSLGLPLERDALAVIVALRTDISTGAIDTSWVAEDLAPLVMHQIPLWAGAHGVRPPADPVPTLSTYLRFLAVHQRFGSESAPAAQIRRALLDLPRSRGRRAHPAAGTRVPAPVLPLN